jgi:hypothetical protein
LKDNNVAWCKLRIGARRKANSAKQVIACFIESNVFIMFFKVLKYGKSSQKHGESLYKNVKSQQDIVNILLTELHINL